MLWFVPCVIAWYFVAPWADSLVASGARVIVDAVLPGVVRQAEVGTGGLTFVTSIAVQGGAGVITVDVNPRLYSYGIALYAAIVLGAGAGGRWWTIPAGIAVALAVTVWGTSFDLMAQLVRSVPAEIASYGARAATRNLIALGYQVGSLMLPTVVPTGLALAVSQSRLLPTSAGTAGRRRDSA